MSQPLNFRNSSNTSTFVSMVASTGTIVPNSGVLNIIGKTSAHPCYLQNGRLLPKIINNSSNLLSIDIGSNNNHHINTSVSINNIDLINIIPGQTGHIVIHNTANVSHNISWTVNTNPSLIKWFNGVVPTLSSNANTFDIISYYVFDPTNLLMIPSVSYF